MTQESYMAYDPMNAPTEQIKAMGDLCRLLVYLKLTSPSKFAGYKAWRRIRDQR